MKLTTGIVAIIAFTIVAILAILAVLIIDGEDPSPLLTFLAVTIIPSITGILAYGKASQAANNTNGRMSELLGLLHQAGVNIPEQYKGIAPSLPVSEIPVEYRDDTPGKAAP